MREKFRAGPLKSIYGTFCHPTTGTFAWVGAEEADIIMLNDFRLKPSIIAWDDMLLLLEGDIVHLPAPKISRNGTLSLGMIPLSSQHQTRQLFT